MGILHTRLKNCLETLLDLQPTIRKSQKAEFAEDFSKIRQFLGMVEKMELVEEDVLKIEEMTGQLLQEPCFSRNLSILVTERLQ